MRVECSVHGLRPEPVLAPGQPRPPPGAAAALAPGSGALVVAGAHALLQFYDAARDRHVDKLQARRRGRPRASGGRGGPGQAGKGASWACLQGAGTDWDAWARGAECASRAVA